MNEKKICFFTPVSLASVGGGERVLTVVANQLAKYYNVSIVTYNSQKSFYFLDERVKLISLGFDKSNNYFLRRIQPVFYLRKFRKHTIKAKYDTIISFSEIGGLFTSLSLLFLKKYKRYIWIHNSIFEPQPFVIDIFRKVFLPKFDKIIVINSFDLDIYIKQKGLINTIRIPNPITIKSDDKSTLEHKRIISIGRLNKQKGFDYLINAAAPVLKKHPNWQLEIFGQDDGAKQELEQLIVSYNLEKQIKIHPPKSEIMAEYIKSSIFAFTSLFEAFGLVLLEASEAGLPLICFNSPSGIADIVKNNFNGFLIDKYDTASFSTKLNELVNDINLRKELAKGSEIVAREHSINKIMKQWHDIL